MAVDEPVGRLEKLRERLESLLPSFGTSKEAMEEFHGVSEELYRVERELSSRRKEEYAVPCELGIYWSAGAPLPHVLSDGHSVYLIFLVGESGREWNEACLAAKESASSAAESLVLVEFTRATVKFGGPNEEVIHGHPLYGKGLDSGGANYVMNSQWARELERINQVHSRYDPNRWKDVRHYFFAFHDQTFECLATGHRVELHRCSIGDLLQVVIRRLSS